MLLHLKPPINMYQEGKEELHNEDHLVLKWRKIRWAGHVECNW